ncbi:hypothetical protein CPB84DRAFT_1776044 [Gymnopilus junonius]|uniref:Uncharacterized protein n=1 Tax=Gymnopilus junonius TaxID=109634 RepID=A0A9P5NSM5_GYMJU|nr:hypothetical protein CPB84DRAFT_1776044 [Gymnopilus junonius]
MLPSLRSLRPTTRSAYFIIIAFLIWRTLAHVPLGELHLIDCKIDLETQEALARTGNVRITHGTLQVTAEDDSSDGEI